MHFKNERDFRMLIQRLDDFEPDKAFVDRVEAVCLKKIRRKRQKQTILRATYRSGAAVACLCLAIWSYYGSGQKLIQHTLYPLKQQPLEHSSAVEPQQQDQIPAPSVTVQQPAKTNITSLSVAPTTSIVANEPKQNDSKGDEKLVSIAKQFLQDMVGEKDFRSYRSTMVAPLDSGEFEVSFRRFNNELPAAGSKISVIVDRTGAVKKLIAGQSVDQQIIAQSHNLATVEQLKSMLAERLTLYYKESSSTLTYVLPKLADLDARSGRFIGIEDITSWRYPFTHLIDVKPQHEPFMATNPQEAGSTLSHEAGIDTNNLSYVGTKRKNNGNEYTWEKGNTSVTVGTSSDGKITHFSFTDSAQQLSGRRELVKVSEKDARDIAVRFLSRHLPQQIPALFLGNVKRYGEDSMIEFYFYATHEKIPVRDHQYVVKLDLTDGRIIGFDGDFTKVPNDLPDPTNIMEGIEVINQYLSQHPPALLCTPGRNQMEAPDFIYSLPTFTNQSVEFDAKSGKLIQ
jgi:hypothetical protein